MPKKFDGDYQPANRRGADKLTLILEAVKENSLLELGPEATKKDAEKAVFSFLAKSAFNPTPETVLMANNCLNLLIRKGWPDKKPSAEPVYFEFDSSKSPSENANSVLNGVSSGDIPPDIGQMLIGMIKDSIAIQESTEVLERLAAIEEAIKNR